MFQNIKTLSAAIGKRLRIDVVDNTITPSEKLNAKTNLGLNFVDNTSDVDKPVSTAQQIALDNYLAQAESYSEALIQALISVSPSTLDTFNELANAIGNDPNFSSTILDLIAKRVRFDIDTQNLSSTEKLNARKNIGLENWDADAFNALAKLPISRGGTNSNAALNNNRIIVSVLGSIVEHSVQQNKRISVYDMNGLPSGYDDFVRDESGNVGIGTNSPVVKLQIDGAMLVDGLRSNDIAIGTYDFWAGLVNEIQTNFNGTGKHLILQFTNGGNVGVGTNAPIAPLNVRGANNKSQFVNQSSDGTGHIAVLSYSQGNQQIYFDAVYDNGTIAQHSKSFAIVNFDGQLRFQGNQGLTPGVAFGYENILVLDIASRGVGIGGNGLNPTSRLDVVGNTSSLNQFRLREGVAFIGSHLSGDVLHDIDKTFKIVTARGVKESILTSLWKQFVNKNSAIANVETSILSTSSIQFEGDRNISANHYQLGKTFDFNVIGTYTLTDDPITATFFIYIGATKIRTITLPALGIVTALRWELNFKTIQTTATTKQTLGTLIINTDDTNAIRVALPINSTTGFPTGLFDLKAVSDLATNSFLPSVNYATLKIE